MPFFVGCLIAAAGAGTADAQPEPPPSTIGPPSSAAPGTGEPAPAGGAPGGQAPAGPASAVAPRDDAGWQLYHDAFGALLEGRRRRALSLVARLRREHAGHPASALIDGSPLAVGSALDRGGGAPVEAPNAAARAELALFQTMHGIAVGVELCVVIECDSPEAVFGLALLGGGAGALASLQFMKSVTSGQRALLNSGTIWGGFNALMAIIASEPNDEGAIALGMLAGQGAGLVAGGLLMSRRPTAGQVALASSGGQWAAVLMGLTLAAASNPSDGEVALSLLVAADAGLGLGAYLSRLRPDVSRGQTFVIDASGIVGGIAGGGLGVLLTGDTDDRTTYALAALGVGVGLGAAAYLTRNWGDDGDGDEGGSGVQALVMPTHDGSGGMVGLGGAW